MSKLEQVSSVSDWSVRAALLESPPSECPGGAS